MILIAESGSTKTDWVGLVNSEVSFKTETMGLNPYYVGVDQIKIELAEKIVPFINEKVTELHFYGTGVTDDAKSEIVKKGITKAFGYEIQLTAYSDVIAAAKSLFGNAPGIACILGTGSNSCFWNGKIIEFQIPPLGFWLGDEGSGGHLGKSLILSYLHNEMPIEIREKFQQIYGYLDRLDILKIAYGNDKPNKYFAGYSVFLKENIENDFVYRLVENSFVEFFEKYLLKYPKLKTHNVGFVGSIAKHYEDILTKVSKKHGLNIHKIVSKPIDGLIEYHIQ
jgi:glucosamine kinase